VVKVLFPWKKDFDHIFKKKGAFIDTTAPQLGGSRARQKVSFCPKSVFESPFRIARRLRRYTKNILKSHFQIEYIK